MSELTDAAAIFAALPIIDAEIKRHEALWDDLSIKNWRAKRDALETTRKNMLDGAVRLVMRAVGVHKLDDKGGNLVVLRCDNTIPDRQTLFECDWTKVTCPDCLKDKPK